MWFPNVIWVLLLGMIYSAFGHFEVLNIPELSLDPDVIFFVLVPVLIFAATQKMCLYHFRKVLKGSAILSTLGIVISMFCVAFMLHWVFQVPFIESLLFGVVVSATDPIAVRAILQEAKDLSTEKKMLIEGESILNDGFVVAVFATLSIMIFGTKDINLAFSGGKLILNISGAIVLGVVLGRLARFLLRIWKTNDSLLTVNITLALAFSSFLLAETFHFPGVLAVFAGALSFGYRPEEIDETVHNAQKSVWEYLEYIVNCILFFVLGASFFSHASLEILTITLVLFAVIMLFVSRFIALGMLKPLLRIEGEKMTGKDFWLLNFSGSRGAISIALILLLPKDFTYKPLFITIAFVMVIVSLVFYPLFLKRILKVKVVNERREEKR